MQFAAQLRKEPPMTLPPRFSRPTPQRTSYDPAAPVYAVGDTVYIEDDAYQITELRDDTVQLLPTGMVYPIYRAERKEQFEQLLRADRRNAYYTEFLPIDQDNADQDLRDVLAHGRLSDADTHQMTTLLEAGRIPSEIAVRLSRANPQLLPTGMVYPIYRAERKEQFEQLLRADRRNAYYTEFLPVDPDKADQDLRDVLVHGLMDEADKQQVSTLLQSGRSNSRAVASGRSPQCLLYRVSSR